MTRLPLVSPLDRALFLKAQPYLEGLPPSAIALVAQHTEERSFSRGEIMHAGNVRPEELFFLASGSVRLSRPGAASIDLSAPTGVGLAGYLAPPEMAPAVHAIEEILALEIDIRAFMQILEDDFSVYTTITRAVCDTMIEILRARGGGPLAEAGFPDQAAARTDASLDLVHRLAQVRQAPFFAGSSLTVLIELLRHQAPRELGAGEVLWKQGSPVESMALILDGSLIASFGGQDLSQPAGAMLGAWEIFSSRPRVVTVRSVEPALVIEIERGLFTDMLEDHFEFALDYLRKMSRRTLEARFPPIVQKENEVNG